MNLYISIGRFTIPSYGLMIVCGVLSANLLALCLLKKCKLDMNDFMILEGYTFLGAFFGAKLLYLIVSFSMIDWSRLLELDYFNQLMRGGFVFYGGLIGGIGACYLAGKLHHIDTSLYVHDLIWLIPFIHSFGRIGCHLAGCCYGRPYHGKISVVFPKGSLAPAGIELFPVQLVEAVFLMLIAVVLFVLVIRGKTAYTLELYLVSYSILRFVLEFYRYDAVRGRFCNLSTSQWISMLLIIVTGISMINHSKSIK